MKKEVIPGWAGLPQVFEDKRYEKFKSLQHLVPVVRPIGKVDFYKTVYVGRVPDELTLTAEEIALICDLGNVCFGGYVEMNGKDFICTIYTD